MQTTICDHRLLWGVFDGTFCVLCTCDCMYASHHLPVRAFAAGFQCEGLALCFGWYQHAKIVDSVGCFSCSVVRWMHRDWEVCIVGDGCAAKHSAIADSLATVLLGTSGVLLYASQAAFCCGCHKQSTVWLLCSTVVCCEHACMSLFSCVQMCS